MDPRDFAVLSLDARRLPNMPRQAFKRRSPVAPADARDRALAEQIVAGAVKNWLHLLWLIEHYARRPIAEIDPRARLILAVALYQLRFLERVPDHAIVTEAVKQTRRLREPGLVQAAGFVNAVLRQAIRTPDVSEHLPARSEAAAYARIVLSHPSALFARLEGLLGTEDALKLCEHNNRTPPTLLRLAGGKTIEDLAPGEGVEVFAHEQEGIVVARGARQADFARWSEAGVAQVQDATSAAVVGLLEAGEGMTVLDRCCGMGTKTQQLSERVGPGGRVFAVDAAGARLGALKRLISRRPDLANVNARRAAWMRELPPDWPDAYDRILIDAPCGNSGVLPRRPEARYMDLQHATVELPLAQLAILSDTWPALLPGGLLAYSTCSILPEENAGVVARFLAQQPAAELVHDRPTRPSFHTPAPERYHDGGYVAVLRRR